MDLTAVSRDIARQQYPPLRRSLGALEERVIDRYWDEDAFVRVTYRRFLETLDRCAERFLAEDTTSETPDAPETAAAPDTVRTPDTASAPETVTTPDTASTPETATAFDTSATPETAPMPDMVSVPDSASASDTASTVGETRAAVGTVDVTFTLPAEIHAQTVALCGEFNDWSADDIRLERGSDGTWRTTVALEPGRSYRYRYLIDGQRWENGQQADHYEPNPYGSVDSVIVVR
jgi:hypothetical protein